MTQVESKQIGMWLPQHKIAFYERGRTECRVGDCERPFVVVEDSARPAAEPVPSDVMRYNRTVKLARPTIRDARVIWRCIRRYLAVGNNNNGPVLVGNPTASDKRIIVAYLRDGC